jgi:hypothetical protein
LSAFFLANPGFYDTGRYSQYRLAVAVSGAAAFAWRDVTAKSTLRVGYTGGAEESYGLIGDAEQRIKKMSAWLAQNGLAQNGASKKAVTAAGKWQRTMIFTRSDLPF